MEKNNRIMDRRTQYCKKSILPKSTYRFNTIPIKISARLFIDIDEIILKFRKAKEHI